MVVKLLALGLLATAAARLVLGPRWKHVGRWFNGVVDTALIVLALALGLQLLLLALR